MKLAIIDLWRTADQLPPEQARSQAEELVRHASIYDVWNSLRQMGFTPNRVAKKARTQLIGIIVEQAATGEQVRQIDRMFAKE